MCLILIMKKVFKKGLNLFLSIDLLKYTIISEIINKYYEIL